MASKEVRDRSRRGEIGKSGVMYNQQKVSSRRRGHAPPSYSLQEFREWLFAQAEWKQLFANWIASGYDRWASPSVDRLDDDLPYTFDNIRLVSYLENHQKGFEERVKKNIGQVVKNKRLI